jgi:hypothetical protein
MKDTSSLLIASVEFHDSSRSEDIEIAFIGIGIRLDEEVTLGFRCSRVQKLETGPVSTKDNNESIRIILFEMVTCLPQGNRMIVVAVFGEECRHSRSRSQGLTFLYDVRSLKPLKCV